MEKRAVEMTKDFNIKDRADLEKKHNCNQCNFSTASLSSLKRHKLIHGGEKPFVCSQSEYIVGCRTWQPTKTPPHPLILLNVDNAIIPAN